MRFVKIGKQTINLDMVAYYVDDPLLRPKSGVVAKYDPESGYKLPIPAEDCFSVERVVVNFVGQKYSLALTGREAVEFRDVALAVMNGA